MTTASPDPRSDRTSRRLAWGAPLVVAGVVAAGVVIATASPSSATPTLPARTAAQLLTAVQTKADQSFFGVVRESANFGLPSLPGPESAASLSWQTFLTGAHSAKVWVDGPTKQRLALVGELSEADVVHNARDLWTYTSDSNSVSHSTLPAQQADRTPATALPYNPATASRELLATLAPSTTITVDAARYVANRATYTLTLRPKDTNSTVRKITLAIDAKSWVPLQMQVFGAGSTPAFQLGFTSISYATPAASTFAFHKPAGATVSTDPLGTRNGGDEHGDHTSHGARLGAGRASAKPLPAHTAKPTPDATQKVPGSGWTSVLEVSSATVTTSTGALGGLVRDATTSLGKSGDRLLHTALVNVVLLPDGRAFVGAVTPAYLEHVAATAR